MRHKVKVDNVIKLKPCPGGFGGGGALRGLGAGAAGAEV